MKSLLVIENPDTKERIIRHLSPIGFDFIHYSNPVKALDNIEEIFPDLVIFNAEDFPRHWKPYIRLLRELRGREEAVFILLRGESFPAEEASKASALGVNGIVRSNLEDEEDIQKLEDIFSRYGMYDEERGDRRISGKHLQDVEFIFTHPLTLTIVTGSITDLSLGGLRLDPDSPQLTSDIPEGETIKHCSLGIEGTVFTVAVKLIRNNRILAFKFADLSDKAEDKLIEYLDHTPQRMLQESG